ncbi:DUF3085 domain-containing protein [Bartonella choladocola]|uniref:Uncharacterized protein n=1 Tax=Bartonella choladocola TaxID=2750995 RepID=A0A1U9MJU6_9HYPH|nr:DUF3085 domain-containing protein [Bartonella choladocola]AQT47990.1 Protein of unknown function (DUF3085) [Bartonella choladocola]
MLRFKYQNLMPVLLDALSQSSRIKLCKNVGVYFCPARQSKDNPLIAYAEKFDPRKDVYDTLCYRANQMFGDEEFTELYRPTDDVFQEILNIECDLAAGIINDQLKLWPIANEKMLIH